MSNRNEDLDKLFSIIENTQSRLNEQSLSVFGVPKFESLEKLIRQALKYIEYTQNCGYFLPHKSIKPLISKWDIFKDYFTINHEEDQEKNIKAISDLLYEIKDLTYARLQNDSFIEVKNEYVENLLEIIEKELIERSTDYPSNLIKLAKDIYVNNLTDSKVKDRIVKDLFEIQNEYISYSIFPTSTIRELYLFLKDYELELNKVEFSNQVKEHNKEIKVIRENLGLKENESLIQAYKTEADKYKRSISNYTYSIIFLFSVISALILFNIIIYKNDYDWHKYVFFVTFIFSLTGFLAFLIKERSRLVSLQTYCIKNYLELTALPDYMAELTKEQAQALRVELAKSYFKGYEDNLTNSNDEKSITQVSNNVDQVMKTLTELKGLLSKQN
ncbi:TPA: hypothetical protein JIY89_12415 [Acinetobacter baumannii]|nr:hypothetical protein [Acinetobacter baumannii]